MRGWPRGARQIGTLQLARCMQGSPQQCIRSVRGLNGTAGRVPTHCGISSISMVPIQGHSTELILQAAKGSGQHAAATFTARKTPRQLGFL